MLLICSCLNTVANISTIVIYPERFGVRISNTYLCITAFSKLFFQRFIFLSSLLLRCNFNPQLLLFRSIGLFQFLFVLLNLSVYVINMPVDLLLAVIFTEI